MKKEASEEDKNRKYEGNKKDHDEVNKEECMEVLNPMKLY